MRRFRYTALATSLLTWSTLLACGGEKNPPTPPPTGARIISFTAEPASIELGSEVLLRWETEGASGVAIDPRVGLQPANGTAIDRPLVTTTYRLTIPGGPEDLVAEVRVEVTGGAPRVTSFTASPRTIMLGDSTTLQWTAENADKVLIEPGLGEQPATGSAMVMPDVTTTYRLVAIKNEQQSQPSEVTVVVASGNQPFIKVFEASPQSVPAGEPVTLRWEALNSSLVTIDNGIGQQPTMGTVTVNPNQSTTYTLTAVGPGGQANASVSVNVIASEDPQIKFFTATPETVAPGATVELRWDTEFAESVSIDNGVGAQDAKGDVSVMPQTTTTYTLTAFGNGMEVTAQVTVTVVAPNEPVVLLFEASPQTVVEGGSVTLSWTTQNVMSVDIDNGAGTALPPNGSLQVTPMSTTTYTLTANGANGQATSQVTVQVNAPAPLVVGFSAQPASINQGGSTSLTWTTQNADSVLIDNGVGMQPANGSAMVSPNQNTLYTLTAMGAGGQTTAQVSVVVTMVGAPTIVSFSAMPQQISPGAQTTLSWNVTDATTITIDNGVGMQPAMGSAQISPATDTTYTLTADGPGGQTTAQVTVTVVSIVGDTCADAFVINGNGTFVGNTQTANNDYQDSNSCTNFRSTGPDVVYRLTLQAGDRLQASLQPANGANWDASIYLVTSCGDIASSCVAGQDNGNPEDIDYTTVAPGDYFLIVDGFGGQGGDYSLTVNVSAAPIPNDTCMGAVDVTAGGVFSGDTTNAMGDYTPITSGLGGCTGFTAASRDVTYSVNLQAGERLQASLAATWDSSLYLVTDCADTQNSCVAGQDNGNPEEVDFTAMNAGTYFIIVDGFASARGPFDLSVTISPPVLGGDICEQAVMIPAGGGSFQSDTTGLMNDYDPPTSCTGFSAAGADQAYSIALAEGDIVEVSSDFAMGIDGAIYAVTDCNNIMSCVAGADDAASTAMGQTENMRFVAQSSTNHFVIVDSFSANTMGAHDLTVTQYTGETCADGAPLDLSGTPEWFSTQGKMNDYSPNSGGCTRFSAAGPDRVYTISVNAGDQVYVEMDPDSFDASLYMVSNCADISGSCVQGSDRGVSATEIIAPVFQTSGIYQLIVDGFGASGSGTGTLKAEVHRGDTCDDAYMVPPGGGTFMGTTAGYNADYGTMNSTGSCTGFGQRGRDAVYAVSLDDGETIDATLTTTWDSALYLIEDCANSGTTCVAGQDSGNPEQIMFTNMSGQTRTYFLVVDAFLETATLQGNYSLDISIQ